MFCKNCGKEITQESNKCEFCGCDLKSTKSGNSAPTPLRTRKKKVLTIIISTVVLVLITTLIIIANLPKTPKIEDLKSDFIAEVFGEKEYTLTTFDIVNETDGTESPYKAIVNVVYDNTKIQYQQQYEVFYNKYSDVWLLDKIEKLNKHEWVVKPIKAPDVEDIDFSYFLYDKQHFGYDVFECVKNKTRENLDIGEAVFVFNVKKEDRMQTVSGEIEFTVVFDNNSERWSITEYSFLDSYKVNINLLNSWSGNGELQSVYKPTEHFKLIIEKWENKQISAKLTFKNTTYVLTGYFEQPTHPTSSILLDLTNEEEKLQFHLTCDLDGTIKGTVYTRYEEGLIYRYNNNYEYKVELTIDEN